MKKKSVPFLWGLGGGVLLGACLGAGIISLCRSRSCAPANEADESDATPGEPGRTPGQAEGAHEEAK